MLSGDSCKASKTTRLSYHRETGTLVAKVMPSPEHEIASEQFQQMVNVELHLLRLVDEIEPLGSTTVTIDNGDWKKQADCSWGPAARGTKLNFVVEIGLSESASKLDIDARGWLKMSTSAKVVVTIEINRASLEVTISRWELCPSSPFACRTAIIQLYQQKVTEISDLILPFEKVVGRPINQSWERDLVITKENLKDFAKRIWRRQGFLFNND